MVRVENRFTLPLEEKGLEVTRGWNDEIARQLVVRSQEDDIRQYAGRDATERFPDTESAQRWFESKGHVVYALGQRAALEGIIWFSHEPRPDLNAEYTFAVRMYQAQRGRGLAGAFLEAAHRDFESHERYEGALWLSTDEENIHARRLYEKHGYEVAGTEADRLLMVRK